MFAAGAALFVAALLTDKGSLYELPLFIAAYLLVGWEILYSALRNIMRGYWFDENFLMSIATLGAFAIGEYPEGVAVMLFFRIGEFFQDMAVARSRRSITELMDIRPDYANLMVEGKSVKVAPNEVKIGDILIVKPGEKVPLDAVVLEGNSTLDTSALTGEAVPREVSKADEIISGSINKTGVLTIRALKTFEDSAVSKILDLVQNASAKKAKTENFITKFARYYTPFVVFSAIALAFLPPLLIEGASLSEWFGRALVFLVVSCPCALVVSIPLSFLGGIGGASRNGILVKGAAYLESLKSVDTVVFDKTGTLTKGVFALSSITAANGFDEYTLLRCAAYAEHYSNHPIAAGVKKAYKEAIDEAEIGSHEELSGYGVKAVVSGKTMLVGSAKLMEENGVAFERSDEKESTVYVAVDGVFAGYLSVADELKEDSKKAIENLKALGIQHIVMLTGDNEKTAKSVAEKLGIDRVYAGLLPHQKVEKLESIMKKAKGKTVFVGDGINDAPSLARADIGVAMGGVGSDAAIEAADVVIMTDEISKVATAVKIARKTNAIVWQNIFFALGVKALIMAMGAYGTATLWEAVFADVGVALIAVLNATRALKVTK
jgi:Cd2+/Zn2+-exporting ATPase